MAVEARVTHPSGAAEFPTESPVEVQIQLFIVAGSHRDVDVALAHLPSPWTFGRSVVGPWSTAVAYVRTDQPSEVIQTLRFFSPGIHVEVLRDLRFDRRLIAVPERFRPVDFLFNRPTNLLSDLKLVSYLRIWKLSSLLTPLEVEALLQRLAQYLNILDQIVTVAQAAIQDELGPQKRINRKGFRYVPKHEMVTQFIGPARAVARDIFRIVAQFDSSEARIFFYQNVRKADSAGFFALKGSFLSKLLEYDLELRLNAIGALAREARVATEETVQLPNLGRSVSLKTRPQDKGLVQRLPDPVFALGGESSKRYQVEIENFIRTAMNLPPSLVLYSFLRDLVNWENFVQYQSSQNGEITPFQLQRYQRAVNSILSRILREFAAPRVSENGLLILESALVAIRNAESFMQMRDKRSLDRDDLDELESLRISAQLKLKSWGCELGLYEGTLANSSDEVPAGKPRP